MLDQFTSGVRFSRDYAALLLRYLCELYPDLYSGERLTQEAIAQLNITELNRHLRASISALRDNSYGLEIARRLHISDFGIMGYAALNSCSLHQAARTSIRYCSLLVKGISTSVMEHDESVEYRVDAHNTQQALWPIIEFELGAAVRFSQLSTHPESKRAILVKQVSLRHPPLAKIDMYEKVFGCTPTFNTDVNSLVVHRDALKQSTQNPNGLVFKLLEDQLSAGLTESNSDIPLRSRVQHLRNEMPQAFPTQQDVAKHFCLSVSGLKRKLHLEGCSFRSLIEEERFKLTKKALAETNNTVKKISYDLGFSDQSAFNRAFKRWSGATPIEYREKTNTPLNSEV